MLLALGAASAALDALKSLTSTKSTAPQPSSASPFDLSAGGPASGNSTAASGFGGGSQISPATMSALLAAQGQSSTANASLASTSKSDALKDLFAQIDANGDGQLSKSEFENALGAGGTNLAQADDVFGKLDKDGNGTVSLDELTSALKGSGKGHHRHHHAAGSDGAGSASMLEALQGASSTSVTNSDGSTTTSLSYADGSTVTMTSAAAASSAATSSYNFIEQMIARQAQAVSSTSSASMRI